MSFAAVNIVAIIRERLFLIQRSLKAVVSLITEGQVRVRTPLRIFSISKVEKAFRYLQSSINAGSVAIDIAKSSTVLVGIPSLV
jgi:hypothetical protein